MTRIPKIEFTTPDDRRHAAVDLRALTAGRRLPASLRIVAENVARSCLAGAPNEDALEAVLAWKPGGGELSVPLAVTRVMMPDSSGLPALMDLAAARDLAVEVGGAAGIVEPTVPVTLVIDHSLIVDVAGHPNARDRNIAAEFQRNKERYEFFKWAQQAFCNLKIVPPGAGIIHQVHLESIARVVESINVAGSGPLVAPEFVLACDSHTTMVNGLGLLAWGVGGIEGEAAMLGESYLARIPRVVGVRLTGRLPAGSTTTDLVLTITNRLRAFGVVGAFVEVFGPGVAHLSVPDRATISNMSPEYGSTAAYFQIDDRTLEYLRATGRPPEHVGLVETYAKAAGLFADGSEPEPAFDGIIEIDLAEVAPTIAGPRRPQDRVPLNEAAHRFRAALSEPVAAGGFGLPAGMAEKAVPAEIAGETVKIRHGSIAIAAITSCTNTSNPSVMIGAGLLARNAVARGLGVPAWVKTSMTPGSRVVEDYLVDAGLMDPLETLGFHIAGIGCATCGGKSGPLPEGVVAAAKDEGIVLASILSGNRNFEGRVNKSTRANYLASPQLVVAYALAGRIDIDFAAEPLGTGADGSQVFLADIWPGDAEIAALVRESEKAERFHKGYRTLYDGSDLWQRLSAPAGQCFAWDPASTYILRPPFFELPQTVGGDRVEGVRVLVKCGDSLTTDHITPAGEIVAESMGGRFLVESGVAPGDFNAVTQRRGNHEFMARMTFGNVRMHNELAPDHDGGFTRRAPEAAVETIYEAAEAWKADGVPAMVLAGRDYGMGSSRDWAAKGPRLLGVRLVLAVSFERIHRSNLVGMGILPLVFESGETAESLGLTGFERFDFVGLEAALATGAPIEVTADAARFRAFVDVTSRQERDLLQNGGLFGRMGRHIEAEARVRSA